MNNNQTLAVVAGLFYTASGFAILSNVLRGQYQAAAFDARVTALASVCALVLIAVWWATDRYSFGGIVNG